MTSVCVFVDDAVWGRLPSTCAKTGAPADGMVRIQQMRGGIGVGWLLVFLGPVGWLVLIVLAATSRPEVLTVRVPMSAAAVARAQHLRRRGVVAALACPALLLGALLQLDPVPVAAWLVAAAVAAVVAVAFGATVLWTRVGVDLDASRRWVTLSRVHPEFAAAVQARRAARDHSDA